MRRLTGAVALYALLVARPFAAAQEPPTSPRAGLPFATEPDRLPGPPRAVGELPVGETQPPSTLPGNLSGPPRAVGEVPQGGPATMNPGPGQAGGTPAGPAGSDFGRPTPFLPLGPASPGAQGGLFGLSRPGPPAAGVGDLPPALPDLPAPLPAVESDPGGIGTGPPLSQEEVVGSALQTYPSFLAVLQERAIAGGELLSATGAFDLNLNMDSRNYPLGYYRRSVQDVFLDQPLRFMGAEVFTGYRIAEGRWPTYYNYLNTRSGGAFVGGFKLPLLKNRSIDARRAKLYQSEIERQKVEPTVLKERISLVKSASKAYWEWVGAGQTLVVYRDLVRLVDRRGAALEAQAREQLIRPIDLVDFRRLALSRQQQLVTAERRFQRAEIELSLYYRDSRCLPTLPKPAQVPPAFPWVAPPDPALAAQDVEAALRLRPELLGLRLQARKAQIERQYAENQTLPSLSLYVYAEQNVGDRVKDLGKDFRPLTAETSLLFDVPLQRRQARGRIAVADGVLRQLALQARLAADRIQADVRDAHSATQVSWRQVSLYREYEAQSRRLEQAEATLAREGASTTLLLNLREQSTSDARAGWIDAQAKFFSALADYRAALGLDAIPLADRPAAPPAP